MNATVNVNVNVEGQSKLHEAGREQGHKESVRAQEEVSHQGLHVQQVHAKMKWMAGGTGIAGGNPWWW